MRAYIYDSQTLKRKDMYNVLTYNISADYVSDSVSEFGMDKETTSIEIGDIIEIDDGFVPASNSLENYHAENGGFYKFKPFIGVISSLGENMNVSAVQIYNLFRPQVLFESVDSISDVTTLIHSLNTEEYNLPPIVVNNLTPTPSRPFSIFEQGKPFTTMILRDLIIELFKKANVVMSASVVKNIQFTEGRALEITFKEVIDRRQVRNNIDSLLNWQINYSATSTKSANKVTIVEKETGKKLRTYYATESGEVVDTFDSGSVIVPVANEFIEHDENRDFDTEAINAIGGYRIANSITCDIDLLSNHLLTFKDLKIGTLYTIHYDGLKYTTYLSGYIMTSETVFTTLLFGYERETLQNLIRRL